MALLDTIGKSRRLKDAFSLRFVAAPCLIELAIAAGELRRTDIGKRIDAETATNPITGMCLQCELAKHG